MTYVEICNFIKSKLGRFYNSKKVDQQLRNYRQRGYSYDDVYERVLYWYEYSGKGDPSKSAGGIAIIDYIETQFQEWKKKKEESDKVKNGLNNFKLQDEPPQIVHIKTDRTFKLLDST